MQKKPCLPPLPKLRPRPGFQQPPETSTSAKQVTNNEEVLEPADAKTSRLLMKTDYKCGPSGKKRSSGSLIHSIPKFSQVRPNGKLTEVQKMLQSRILSRRERLQKMKLAEEQRQHQQPQPQLGQQHIALQTHEDSRLRASSLLQNIISLHEQRISAGDEVEITPSTSTSSTSGIKRRGRKPAKNEICHVVANLEEEPEIEEPRVPSPPAITIQRIDIGESSKSSLTSGLPHLSEVTITPAVSVDKNRGSDVLEGVLDLRKSRKKSESPEIIELDCAKKAETPTMKRIPAILTPQDFERLGLPAGYVFCPSSGLFVHGLALNPNYEERSQTRPPESLESMQGVMRVKPISQMQEVEISGNPGSSGNRKRKGSTQEVNNEVSICKFKFTGGSNPSLEERKRLSVDSGGNFRYFSGDKNVRAFESLPRTVIQNSNAASIVTDRFKMDKNAVSVNVTPTADPVEALDVMSAFDSLPEKKKGRGGGLVEVDVSSTRGVTSAVRRRSESIGLS